MQYSYSLTALLPLFLSLSSAHSIVTHLHHSNTATTSCVRRAINTNPITDLNSAAMACNNVRSPASSSCSIRAGSTIGFEYRTWPDKAASEVPLKNGVEPVSVTDDSHKGPCAVYAKKVDDAKTAVGEGDGWIKIYHEAVGKDGLFCTDRLRKGNLPLEVKVPMNLGDGDWLFRSEFLTLNNADPKTEREPQFYPGCVQVTITGSTGQAQNPPTVSIPGYIDINSPGLLYNIWLGNDYSSYPKLDKIFGGKLFTDSTSQSPAVPSPVVSSPAVVTPPVDVPKVPTTFVTRVATSSKSEATKVPTTPDTPKQDEDKESVEEVPGQAECKKWCKIKLVLKQLTELYALPEDE